MKQLALIALQSSGSVEAEIGTGPGDHAAHCLLLVAAALYNSRPELVTEMAIGHVEAPAGRADVAEAAGEVLALAVAWGIEPAMRLLSVPAVRDAVSLWAPGRLEPAALPACTVGGIAAKLRRVLMVHNIDDGQGGEIIRTGALVQSLVDCHPELEVIFVTRRLHLYSHPRIRTVSIRDRSAAREALRAPRDALIDFFEPEITEVDYDPELEDEVEEIRALHRPFLDIRSRKGFNHFLFEHVSIDGRRSLGELGVDRRGGSVYEPAARLLARLGLPVRRGEEAPRSEPVLAGVPWPEADPYWDRDRPLLLLAPFGGGDRLKGYVGAEAVAIEIRRWIAEGSRVVVMPTGTSWGTTAVAAEAIGRLSEEEQRFSATENRGVCRGGGDGSPPMPASRRS